MSINPQRVLTRNAHISMRKLRQRLIDLNVRGMTVCVVLLLAVTALTAFGFVRGRANRAAAALSRQLMQPTTTLPHQATAPSTAGEVELITLQNTGFEPAEFSRPTGRFLFGVNNRTSLSDLTFQLVNETGVVVAESRMVRVRVWRQVIDLPAGSYLVRVAGHPEWRCVFTISAQ